jgi:flagellar assembly protein FliH
LSSPLEAPLVSAPARIARGGEIETVDFASVLQQADSRAVALQVARRPGMATQRATVMLDQLREEARQEGYRQGLEQGLREGHDQGVDAGVRESFVRAMALRGEELSRFRSDLEAVMERIREAMHHWYEETERELAPLAIKMAERILKEQLSLDRSAVHGIVRAALSEVTHASKARIRVNPLDLETLREHKDELFACAQSLRNFEIVADPTILGGCIVDTDGGIIDASIDGGLEAFESALDQEAA